MGAQYTVKKDYDNLLLPDGKTYRTGATVVLSDANVALLTTAEVGMLTVVDASVDDPTPPSVYADIESPADVKAAILDLDARLTVLEG